MRTFKVLRWEAPPEATVALPLDCPRCGTEAELPVSPEFAAHVVAARGITVVTDPPWWVPAPGMLPDSIQCRVCGAIFEGPVCLEGEAENVR